MGQWTLDYLDNVLNAKITTLVSGSIQRAALEKGEPSITYENFVKDLDTGDSFTTTFIDILVKEMAERRTRPGDNDRRLIADRTAKSLRVLASELRTYRDRSSRNFPRRPVNLSDYLSAPPNEMDLEDDDEDFDPVLDSFPEGARLNQDLFDAYGLWPTRRIFSSSPSPPAEENVTSVRPPSTTAAARHNPWALSSSSSGTNLRRQSSIRLSSRSRAVDFNDFTSRRRTSIRDAFSSRSEGNDGSGEQRERDAAARNSRPSARRFFPVGRSRTHDSANTEGIEAHNGDISDEGHTFVYEPSVSGGAAWFPVLSPARSASPVADSHDSGRRNQDASDERARTLVHRLRRGGVRAPESIFSPYQEPPSLSALPSSNDAQETENAATSYPTPGPTENGSSSS